MAAWGGRPLFNSIIIWGVLPANGSDTDIPRGALTRQRSFLGFGPPQLILSTRFRWDSAWPPGADHDEACRQRPQEADVPTAVPPYPSHLQLPFRDFPDTLHGVVPVLTDSISLSQTDWLGRLFDIFTVVALRFVQVQPTQRTFYESFPETS